MISTNYSIVSQTCMCIVSEYKPVKGCWHTQFCLHSKSKRSVSAPKCWFSSIAPGADLTLRGTILSIWSKSTPIKTIAAPSKTVLAHRRNCFSHVMRIGPFHKSHFYSKNRDISGFSLVGPYLGLTWPILIELFRPHDNAKWLDH